MENISGTFNKGIDILEIFLQRDGEFSLAEIAELGGFNKATAYRLVSTLVKRGFIIQHNRNGKYSLGLKILDFTYAIRKNIHFIELAYVYLSKLGRAHNVSAYISVLDADSSLVVEEVAAVELMRINSPIGKRMPLYATACGRVLLSSLSRKERESYYSRNTLVPFTSKTLTDISYLEEEIIKVQKDGFAYSEEDYRVGLMAIAAPIYNSHTTIIAAAGIVAPISQFDSNMRYKLAADLKSCAGEISQVLGRSS